jgi:hypothetical protein
MAEMTQSEKMKAYWAEKKAREAEERKAEGPTYTSEELTTIKEKMTGAKCVDDVKNMFTLEPIAPIPTDRETFDALVAQMSTMTSGGARETIIDQNRALLLSGIAQGWNIGTWMERKEKKEGA